jgi:hypothetical protein
VIGIRCHVLDLSLRGNSWCEKGVAARGERGSETD